MQNKKYLLNDFPSVSMNLSGNYFWRGLDYHETTNQLILHAENSKDYYQEDAHVVFENPALINCAALLRNVQFSLDDHSHPIVSNIESDSAMVTVLINAQFNNYRAKFYVVCEDVYYKFQENSGDLDEFHTPEIFEGFNRIGRTNVSKQRELLESLDGCSLRWKSISSSLSCETKLRLIGNTKFESIVFFSPYFLSMPRTMSSVIIRPSTVEDLNYIQKQLGDGYERVLAYKPHKGGESIEEKLKNIVTIKCNEGHYFICGEGVDFDLLPTVTNL